MRVCMFVCMYVCMYVCMLACVHACRYVYTHVHMYVYVYIYMYMLYEPIFICICICAKVCLRCSVCRVQGVGSGLIGSVFNTRSLPRCKGFSRGQALWHSMLQTAPLFRAPSSMLATSTSSKDSDLQ